MAKQHNYYKVSPNPVAHHPTKYDDCTLKATGREYRFQKGSGRSEILNRWAADGARIGDITAAAAQAGFDPNFVVGALFRQHETKDGAWRIEPPPGRTLEELKGAPRGGREPSPETIEKRERLKALKEERAREKEAKAAEREAAKLAKEAERAQREAERAARKAEREQAKDAAKEQAKALKAEAEAEASGNPVVKARRKGKTPQVVAEETVPA